MTVTIQIHELGISFAHKTCFENFSTTVNYGDRIAIIGQNGSGKSTLIKVLQNQLEPSSGKIQIYKDVIFGYVPQVIYEFECLSGGQRLNQTLTKALSVNPNVLVLDEPTNHLDYSNRKSLMRMLKNYSGTLIAVSHDVEFLQNCVDTLWHIDNGKIHIFSGNYNDYMREVKIKRASIEQDLSILDRKKKDAHQALMKEQERASKRKSYGEKKYAADKLTLRAAQERGENTQNKNKKNIASDKGDLIEKLSTLRLPEVLTPKFSLKAADMKDCILVSITDGSVSYNGGELILKDINISLSSKSRIALQGDNGSGKSTFLKAILGDKSVVKLGNWHMPQEIGYLDQHYVTLSLEKSVFETIAELAPTWNHAEIRKHLNDFLFRKNEEVNAKVSQLSGGEKLRLSLAQIAAKTQKFLILDEITNNVDLLTKNHIMEFLNTYPGGYIIVCHDNAFLEKLHLNEAYLIKNKTLLRK